MGNVCPWLSAAEGVPRSVLAVLVLLAFAGPARACVCTGDCDANRLVTANEIVLALRSDCPAADLERNPYDIFSMIGGVFGGCPAGPVLPRDWEEAFDASEIGWMMSGWGPGDGSLWVVGGGAFTGRMFHLDCDGDWAEVELGFRVPLLNWVNGTSAADVFVGGNDGTILHFDGESWTAQETPVTTPVWGIWAVAPDDVWAVGGSNVFGDAPFVLRYDGVEWSRAPIPVLQRPGVRAFFKVWGSGPGDVYAVGQNGAVLHWDGTGFTELGLGISQDLIGIWGTGPDNIAVVGGRGTAERAHFDGTRWHRAPPSRLPGLNGVWMHRGDVAHAVGVAGTVLRFDPRTLEVLEEVPVPTTLELHSVFGDRSGQLLIFGANFDFPERGVVLIRRMSDDD